MNAFISKISDMWTPTLSSARGDHWEGEELWAGARVLRGCPAGPVLARGTSKGVFRRSFQFRHGSAGAAHGLPGCTTQLHSTTSSAELAGMSVRTICISKAARAGSFSHM